MSKLKKILERVDRQADRFWNEGFTLGRRSGYQDGVDDTRREVSAQLEKKLELGVQTSGRKNKRANLIKMASALGYSEAIGYAVATLRSYTGSEREVLASEGGYVDIQLEVTEAQEAVVTAVIHEGELRARDKMLGVLKSRQHWYPDNHHCDCYECVELRTLESIIRELIK